jgi:Flp pilus assembly protein TadG
MTTLLRRPGHRPSRGQGLVEFALVFPVFLLLIFVTIDAGRFIFAMSAVSNAAREGARLGSVEASWMGSTDSACGTAGGPVCPPNLTTLRTHVTDAANRQMSPFGAVTNLYLNCVNASGTPPSGNWTTTTCASPNSGGQISVRVTFAWTALTPVIGNILGTLDATGSATVTIN